MYRTANNSDGEQIQWVAMTRKSDHADPNALSDRDYVALANFRRSLRIFLAFSEKAARKAGLTPQQHQAILTIRGLAPRNAITINELAEQLLLKPQTAVELVDRLELAGLARRERDSDDRRRVRVSLTVKATDILNSLSNVHLEQIRRDAPQLIAFLGDISREDRNDSNP